MAQAHSVMHITIRACFLCFFYDPYMSLLFFIHLYNICMQVNAEDLDDSQYITVKFDTCAEFFPLCGIKEHCISCIQSVQK